MTFILLTMLCYSFLYLIVNMLSSTFDRILDTNEDENDENNESDVNNIL